MSDVLLIARKGAGIPMRVTVVRRPGERTRAAVRRLDGAGVPRALIARRLALRPGFVARLLSSELALGWGPALRLASRAVEMEMAA